MKTNRWLDGSNRFFNVLMNLYPHDHRDDYAGAMRQVFSAQCKEAYSQRGFLGILALWLRVLPDLGYTAIVEHLSSPKAAWGLLEPVPNAPLPWKGVFLVLLPGLVYLVSQIAQLTGSPWYPAVYYRAAFFLIIPVLIVWAVTRKFPIWGLIPVGLLFRLVQEIGYQLIILHPGAFSTNAVLNAILQLARLIETNLFIPAGFFALISIILAVVYFKKRPATRGIKIWITAYLVVAVAQVVQNFSMMYDAIPYRMFSGNPAAIQAYYDSALWDKFPLMISSLAKSGILDFLLNNLSYILYNTTAVFLLIMMGTLLTKRQGFYSIFILVGYYLPVMLVGASWDLGDNPQMLLVISVSVLLYRALLTFIAPVWMSRSVTLAGKKKVIISCIMLALFVHMLMQFFPSLMFGTLLLSDVQWVFPVLLEELIMVVSFLLGIALYQNSEISAESVIHENDQPQMLGVEDAQV
jgi:hypothetical protein